jgi:glycosyltransferase 2 family protein
MSEPAARRWLDPRVAFGVLVSGLAVWWAFRGVPFGQLWETLAGADLTVVVFPTFACFYASIWVRALRWQHLAAGMGALPLAPAYRATAIRFMANNLFPLRLGEFAGAWVVSRDVGGSPAAWFGTIVLERAFDMAAIMSLAIFLVADRIELGALRYAAFVPMLGIAALRLWPKRLLALGHALTRAVLPAKLAARLGGLIDHVVAGLGGIRDARGLALVICHTVLLWGVISPLPFLFAQRSLGVELGGAQADFMGALMTMVGVGVAVALPQAPGFVGVYHVACVTVLSALGVPQTLALAVGTLAHALFWISINLLGVFALRGTASSLTDALRGDQSPRSE